MKVEKEMTVDAPVKEVWACLLDPEKMAECVPGTESVQELGDREYAADIKVKISFISAKFRMLTKIVEMDAPNYLRCEGTGEDSKIASSIRQTSELFLTESGDGGTNIEVRTEAQVFGRLGSLGLSVMKTKVDRLWEEFGDNLRELMHQDRC